MGKGLQNRLIPLELATFSGASLTTSYQAMNPGGFERPVVLYRLLNQSANLCTISFDGSTDHDILLAAAVFFTGNGEIDLSSNPSATSYLFFPKGTEVFLKSTTSNAGSIFLATYSIVVRCD